jgi:hypothetical protein
MALPTVLYSTVYWIGSFTNTFNMYYTHPLSAGIISADMLVYFAP